MERKTETSLLLLPDELVMDVLCWVLPIDLLSNASLVSHKFASLLLRTQSFWEKYSDLPLEKIESMNFTTVQQWQRSCLFVSAAKNNRQQQQHSGGSSSSAVVPKYLKLGSCLVRKDTTKTQRNELYCVATTTDHSDEALENVLIDYNTESQVANDWDALPKQTPGLTSWELAIRGMFIYVFIYIFNIWFPH